MVIHGKMCNESLEVKTLSKIKFINISTSDGTLVFLHTNKLLLNSELTLYVAKIWIYNNTYKNIQKFYFNYIIIII